jgi:hypothetical protein
MEVCSRVLEDLVPLVKSPCCCIITRTGGWGLRLLSQDFLIDNAWFHRTGMS